MAEDNGFAMGYALGQDAGGNANNGMGFGMDGIISLAALGLIFGDGNGGGLFGGGNRNNSNGAPWATQADVRSAVDQQTLVSKLDQQTYGISDLGYALNNTITNGFHGVDNAICSLGYNIQTGINGISREIGDCCYTTQRAIDGVNFNMAKGLCDLGNAINSQTRDIIENQNANYRGIMDFMVNEKLASKDARIAELSNQLSQSQQNSVIRAAIDASTAEIIRRTGNDCPTPAYWVSPPTPVTPPCGGFANYGNNGCGCGCGC